MTASSPPPARRERRAAARRDAKAQVRARRSARGKQLALAFGAVATVGTGITLTHAAPASATPTLTVTSTADTTDPGTLRWAITQANTDPDADVIGFNLTGSGLRTITLGSALPTISESLTIEGLGSGFLAVDGNGAYRPFLIENTTTTTPIEVTISGLTVQGGDVSGDGGGIEVIDEHLTLTDSLVSGNAASGNGGGIAAISHGGLQLHVSGSVVSDNDAASYGGGIIVDDPASTASHSSSVIEGTTIDGNSASIGGGVAVRFISGMAIRNSTISNNQASNAGGGLAARRTGAPYDLLQVESTTISGNTANNGGGIYALDGTGDAYADLVVSNSTIAANAGTSGFRVRDDVQAVLSGSIVSGTVGGDDLVGTNANVNTVYSLVQEVNPSGIYDNTHNRFGVDPQLGALALDPASTIGTATMRPAATSPAIDHGGNYGPSTDQRGLDRYVGSLVDIGAVELQSPVDEPALSLATASDLGASDTDGVTSATNLTFDVSGAGTGVAVTLYRDGTPVQTRTGDGPITDVNPGEGTWTYTVTQASDQTTGPGADLTVEVDHTAPGAPSVPDLTAGSDHGTSDTDNLTNATTRTFNLSGVESGGTVTLRQAYSAMSCVSMPFFPFTPICTMNTQYDAHTRTGDGTVDEAHDPAASSAAYTARQTDLAGNTSADSSSLTVSFDFVAPSVPNAPDLQAASDDGSSATDDHTTKASLTFDLSGVDPGVTAQLVRSDGQSGGVVGDRVGSGTITDTDVPVGEHTYFVLATDAAGNESFDHTRSIVVTVEPAFTPAPPATTTTTTPPTSTPPTTDAPPAATAPATSSNPTPKAGETVQLQTAPPSGGSSAGNTASTIDGTKPSSAILLSTNGTADRPMPQPVITKKADGSTSISVQVPADTPPGVYLIAVVGTTPSGQSRVVIVPVVVRRAGAPTPARVASVPAPTATVPAAARSVQASVAALGGSTAVEQAVLRDGATLSIAGDRLIVDTHEAGGDSPVGPAAIVGLLLGAGALIRRSTRLNRSAR